jgi:hypothetical protein
MLLLYGGWLIWPVKIGVSGGIPREIRQGRVGRQRDVVTSLFARKTGKATCIKIRMQNFIVSYIVEVNKCPPKIR